jgi:tripartite-type tricarboxylate transporter receptor subunit TctC
MKTKFNLIGAMAIAAGLLLASAHAIAQQLEGPLRIMVGYAPGGSSDRAARLVAQALQAKHGITVIVENKPGAGGRLVPQQLKLAKPGDNVLMIGNPAVMTVAPVVFKDNNYDPDDDFVPLSEVMTYEFVVAVGPQVPVRDVAQLIEWLKQNPQKAFFGVPATGSLPHFFALMLAERAGVKAEVVGYKGSAPLATELVGGQVPVGIDTVDSVLPLHQAGKLRIVAVSGSKRSTFAPDIPTLAEQNVQLVGQGWNTLYAPKSMPAAKASEYAKAIQAVMADPEVQKQFRAGNMEPVSTSQEQTAAMLKAYRAQWEPVVKRSGYQP